MPENTLVDKTRNESARAGFLYVYGYTIHARGGNYTYAAKDIYAAARQFFLDVKSQKIPLAAVGQLIKMREGKNIYPMRTVPILFKLGVLDGEEAIYNLGISMNELEKWANEDIKTLQLEAK